ncbi:MAG: Gldg family protein [Deltaproteobacteria bacterium]|nr:Gldg family protein [Deltaproteobacteria bacterium]
MSWSQLAIAGAIALVFGLGSYYATGMASLFASINLGAGGLALVVAALGGLRGLRGVGTPAARRVLLPRIALLVLVLAAAVLLERGALRLGWRLDWTAEQRFELSEAMRNELAKLSGPLDVTFYRERGDPRARRTSLLLETIARGHSVVLHERWLDESESEADQFGIQSAEAVVLQLGDRFETVDRPTEGRIYEALWRLQNPGMQTLYTAFGEGEANFDSTEPDGYSGLRVMLETEGYAIRKLVTATGAHVPSDAGAVLVVGPRRAFGSEAVAGLRAYLAGGGGLVALLEPGVRSGLEPVLAEWGFDLPDGILVDPPSGAVAGGAPGLNPIAANYSQHPVTHGLGPRALTLFLTARPVVPARKPQAGDELRALVFSSPDAWLAPTGGRLSRTTAPVRPADAATQRWPFVAAGRYPRDGRQTRVVVFGDSSFADNDHLRALYNLDLLLNAVHWVVQREEAIAIRPKLLTPNQDPLTPQQSLAMLYGVGLLLPELTLIAGAVAWLRRRAA